MTEPVAPTGSERTELLELYKLTVEMADRISSRRGTANAFFVTVESALAAALGLFAPKDGSIPTSGVVAVCAVGVALSAVWWLQLRSYRDLNAAKFKVVLSMENQLVAQPFAMEWAELATDRVKGWRGRYAELGFSERFIPWLFALVYVALGVFAVVN